ncbi:unnamed protein product [Symbiodinium necroappetens]|uniref:Uncharacterized protein n=1 Tax=Symbiodinium necroappetens TaxID=1628268 RepID=A0A812XVK1_9DINO|nr:unnamed protein product [Symbiodinium necroappetens]
MGQSAAGCCSKEEEARPCGGHETIQAQPAQPRLDDEDSNEDVEKGDERKASIRSSKVTFCLDVNPDIIRGISLRGCLRNVRQLWWQSPVDLSQDSRAALWKRSKPASRFDIFLSHTWQTSGVAKCFALMLQSTWAWCLALWLLTMMLLAVLYGYNLLPKPGRYLPQGFDSESIPAGPWMAIFSLPSCLLGVVIAVYLPEKIWSSPTCFLDAVSINQNDQTLMMQGIYGLGGFLKASEELRILWSPPYFSRLWCVFELAAYRTANPNGKVSLSPVFVESAVAAYFFANYVIALLFSLDREALFAASLAGQLLSTFALFRSLRRSLSEKRKLISDLQNFEVEKAQCRLQYDRDFVLSAITEWFGSKDTFTDYVRNSLGKAAMSGYKAVTIPLQYQLLIVLPEVSNNLDHFFALWCGNVPSEVIVSQFLAMVLGYAFCWRMVTLSFAVFLCQLAPSLSSWKMLLVDVLIFLAANLCITGGLFAARGAYQRGLAFSSAWLCLAGLLAWLFQGRVQKCGSRLIRLTQPNWV